MTEEWNIRTTLTSDAKLTSAIKCHMQRQQAVSDLREHSTGHITRQSGPQQWLQGAGHPNMPKATMKKKKVVHPSKCQYKFGVKLLQAASEGHGPGSALGGESAEL